MTMGFSPYHYHQVTHVYHDNPGNPNPQASSDSSGKVIIINNSGSDAAANATSSTSTSSTPYSTSTTETYSSSPYALAQSSTTSQAPIPADNPAPPNGIICIPLKVNETNASGDVIQVERIVCYPAPPPPASIPNEMKSKPVEIAGDIIEH